MFQRFRQLGAWWIVTTGMLSQSVVGFSPPQSYEGGQIVPDGRLWPVLNQHAPGVSIEGTLTFDASVNLHGGVNTNGSAFRHLLDISIILDTEAVFGLEGGTVGILFQNHNGPDASAQDTGDLQVFSNIDADGRTQLAELWYEQVFPDEQFRVVFGKIDANALFAFVEHGAEFIHSSPGFSPTILGFPSYPDPAMSVNVFFEPSDANYIGAGLFDGALNEGILTGSRGPGTFFHDPGDLFIIGETGARWTTTDGLDGRLGVGVWHHNGTFARFDGGSEDGTTGYYAVFDQALWRKDEQRGVNLFAQYGYADERISEFVHHIGMGLTVSGLIPSRGDDLLGLMTSYAHLSDKAGAGFTEDYELAFELFYRVQINGSFSLKPDLQYITHPGGDASLNDAIVATLRGELTF